MKKCSVATSLVTATNTLSSTGKRKLELLQEMKEQAAETSHTVCQKEGEHRILYVKKREKTRK